MRWDATRRNDHDGERIVRRFLFLPKKLIVSGKRTRYQWRWLEMASIQEKTRSIIVFGRSPWMECSWVDEEDQS
jgi:hypothetical protein